MRSSPENLLSILRFPHRAIAGRSWLGASLLAIVLSTSVQAGPEVPVRRLPVAPEPTPVPVKFKISRDPHLVAVGPMELYVKPVAGPRVRRAPLLPQPTPAKVDSDAQANANSAPTSNGDTAKPQPVEPSEFSPDAPNTLLPADKPAAPAASVRRAGEPDESVLSSKPKSEQDLRDAVIYFETPVGPNGSRVTVPASIPLNPPTGAPLPESRATYRETK